MSRNFHAALLLAASGVAVLAACGTQSGTTTGTATAQTPKQRAEADAAAIVQAFVPPPGAQRLAGPPNLPGGLLKTPITTLGDATQAKAVMFWAAPGDPQALLSWEQAHIAKRFTLGDADFGPPAWDRMFELPPIPGVLTSREMVVEVASLGNGKTGIRVDADVAWQPARSASARVPRTATVVTIAEQPSMLQHAKPPQAPVTITDQAVVAKLAALINALPISPFNNSGASCPAPIGGGLELSFRAKPGGPLLAQAQTDQPCGVTAFTIPGHPPLELNNANDQQILKIAGLGSTRTDPGITGSRARTPRQRAEDDAAQLLAMFVAPPGARRLATARSFPAPASVLGHPIQTPGTPNLIDSATFWLVVGDPQAVLGWEERHLPRQLAHTGGATTDGPHGISPSWADVFTRPAIAGVLDSRELLVQVADAGHGQTAIRVDAQVTWHDARPASEVVPAAARAVTIKLVPDANQHVTPPAPVTTTDPAQVRQIVSAVDGLPLSPAGVFMCPADSGKALVLTFRAQPSGPALAVAEISLEGCGGVAFTIGGKQQPALGNVGGGPSIASHVLKIASLPWKLT